MSNTTSTIQAITTSASAADNTTITYDSTTDTIMKILGGLSSAEVPVESGHAVSPILAEIFNH